MYQNATVYRWRMEKEDKRKRAEGTDREGEDSDGGKRVERERKKEVKEVKFQETQTGSPERRPMALLRSLPITDLLLHSIVVLHSIRAAPL
ncbi:hypothetical protein V1477_013032 [Vespula maculifrons]|uniref:Uncharacterized protein n=2 Tax=Vespula TaxID=7451 RepID=A0A834N429_VESGE|nr:hypothetical protein HZH68_010095 [Vespula germanica]